jgi:hypothetical protein
MDGTAEPREFELRDATGIVSFALKGLTNSLVPHSYMGESLDLPFQGKGQIWYSRNV